MDKERRDYLLSLSEYEAGKLPRDEWYDRIRLFRQKAAAEMLERFARERQMCAREKTPPRASNAVIEAKAHWLKD